MLVGHTAANRLLGFTDASNTEASLVVFSYSETGYSVLDESAILEVQ